MVLASGARRCASRECAFLTLAESNRLAHYWLDQGVQRGDVVALIMPNKPTFVIVWVSLMAVGAMPAFINVCSAARIAPR